MGAFKESIHREIRRFGEHRILLTVGMIIPVLLTVLYFLMFSRGTLHDLPVAVYDADKTELSRQLTRMIDATPTASVDFMVDNPEQGRQLILEGKADALVIIGRGLQEKIYSGSGQAQVQAQVSGARILNSGLLKRDLATVLQAFNIGITTQLLGSQGIPAAQGYQIAYPVAFESHILFNPYGSYAYYLLPALLPLLLIITAGVITVHAVGSELRYGTATEWLTTAGGSITRAVTAKLLPYFVLFCLLSILMNTLLYRFLGLPFEATRTGIMVLANIFLILSYMSIGLMLISINGNLYAALSITGGYSTASLSFSGLTFPAMAMFPFMAAIGKIFPFTYFIDIFIEQSMRGAPPARSLGDLAAMGCFILASALFMPRLKKLASEPRFHGKN